MPNTEYMRSIGDTIKRHVQKNSSLSVSRLKQKYGYHGTNYETFKSELRKIEKTRSDFQTSINTALSNLYGLRENVKKEYESQQHSYLKKENDIETTYEITIDSRQAVHQTISNEMTYVVNRKKEIQVSLDWEQYERYAEQALHRGNTSWHNVSNMSEMYSEVLSMFRHTNPLPELSDEFRADTFLQLDDIVDELAQLEL